MTVQSLTTVPAAECRPMTKTETKFFIACTLQAPKVPPAPAKELPTAINTCGLFTEGLVQMFTASVFLTHLKGRVPNMQFDPIACGFIAILAHNPGQAVQWAYTVAYRTHELGRPYTMADWTLDFPDGPPDEPALLRLWDAQKAPGAPLGNLLDAAETWIPFAPLPENADA
jgi:hypothetical protein